MQNDFPFFVGPPTLKKQTFEESCVKYAHNVLFPDIAFSKIAKMHEYETKDPDVDWKWYSEHVSTEAPWPVLSFYGNGKGIWEMNLAELLDPKNLTKLPIYSKWEELEGDVLVTPLIGRKLAFFKGMIPPEASCVVKWHRDESYIFMLFSDWLKMQGNPELHIEMPDVL